MEFVIVIRYQEQYYVIINNTRLTFEVEIRRLVLMQYLFIYKPNHKRLDHSIIPCKFIRIQPFIPRKKKK